MNFKTYERKFTEKALSVAYSEENIIKCLKYAEILFKNNVPVIYNTTHLSGLVGYNKNYLKRAVRHTRYFYREFTISKSNGSKRKILEPLPNLKDIQNWILKEILYNIKISRYAKAYVPNRSIKDHVRYHTNSKHVLTLDIQNFFGSINQNLIESVFRKLGYSAILSNLLTKLCYLETELPQGSPTSPAISNIIMLEFDNAMSIFCRENKLKYTRYADDLAFSGEIDVNALMNKVIFELDKINLKLNTSKTRLMSQNQPQYICGIIVNKKIQVPKNNRRIIRQQMFYINKFGLESHMKKIEQEKQNYIKHLLGSVNYVLTLNPKDVEFLEYKKTLHNIMFED